VKTTSAVATYTLSAALFSVAGAITYFTYTVSQLHRDIPAILTQVDSSSGKVDPILDEVKAIRELVPPILSEIAAVRGEIPSIVNEVKETRMLIPPILQEVQSSRESIPALLKTVDSTVLSINQTNKEVAATRKLVPGILEEVKAVRKEVEATRKSLPPTLDRLDNLVAKAGVAGQKATEGAVTGVFTGVITAPFRALVGLGNVAAGEKVTLVGEDLAIATRTAIALTELNKGANKTWANPESGYRGKLTLLEKYTDDGRECVSMKHQAWKGEREIIDRVFDACRQDSGSPWELKE